jgi:hypothetical protein
VVWATVLEFNESAVGVGALSVVNYQELCRELSAAGPGCFGELSIDRRALNPAPLLGRLDVARPSGARRVT